MGAHRGAGIHPRTLQSRVSCCQVFPPSSPLLFIFLHRLHIFRRYARSCGGHLLFYFDHLHRERGHCSTTPCCRRWVLLCGGGGTPTQRCCKPQAHCRPTRTWDASHCRTSLLYGSDLTNGCPPLPNSPIFFLLNIYNDIGTTMDHLSTHSPHRLFWTPCCPPCSPPPPSVHIGTPSAHSFTRPLQCSEHSLVSNCVVQHRAVPPTPPSHHFPLLMCVSPSYPPQVPPPTVELVWTQSRVVHFSSISHLSYLQMLPPCPIICTADPTSQCPGGGGFDSYFHLPPVLVCGRPNVTRCAPPFVLLRKVT